MGLNGQRWTSIVMLTVLAAGSIQGSAAPPKSVSGTILLPSDVSNGAHSLYLAGGQQLNGILGYVVDMGGPVADGTPYRLTNRGGDGVVSLWAQFYASLRAGTAGVTGQPCVFLDADGDGNGGEVGAIRCGDSDRDGTLETSDRARYAIVIAWAGPDTRRRVSGSVNAKFTLSW